ncbi:MAG: septum formation initiator family protein [Candidatus Sulfobium sp.]|jgi:cell division protein FtsB
MIANNPLRDQVRSELKKRRLVFATFFILCFIYLTASIIFGDMGLVRYVELNGTRDRMERQVDDIVKQNEKLRTQIKLLKNDPFYREKLAREEYGLAKPDEYIFQYDR